MGGLTKAPRRCDWCIGDDLYEQYHDEVWGVPVYDRTTLFEFLTLEGAQAGLSWETVLKRREGYRRAFSGFDARIVAQYGQPKVDELLADAGIIRHRGKIEATIRNARAFLAVQKAFGSFDAYLWRIVGGQPRVNSWQTLDEIPARTPESAMLSKELSKRGFKFVGPTICYALMQAVGMVNDHLVGCFRYTELAGQ